MHMATTLLLMRHADAISALTADMPLSEKGKITQEKMCAFLKLNGYRLHHIYTSTLLRAKQTAEIIGNTFHCIAEEEKKLGSHFDEEYLLALIPEPAENQTIAFVGHAPTLYLFAKRLLEGNYTPPDIERSGALVLRFDESIGFGKACFVTYYSPRNTTM